MAKEALDSYFYLRGSLLILQLSSISPPMCAFPMWDLPNVAHMGLLLLFGTIDQDPIVDQVCLDIPTVDLPQKRDWMPCVSSEERS